MKLNVKMKSREFYCKFDCKGFRVEGPFINIVDKDSNGGCLIPITEIEVITWECTGEK